MVTDSVFQDTDVMTRGRSRPLTALLLAGLLVTGCGGPGSTILDQSTFGVDPWDSGGPIDEFGLSRGDRRTLHAAEEEYVRRCAATAGFQFIPTPYEDIERAQSGTTRSSFGIEDLESAQRDGYGLSNLAIPSGDIVGGGTDHPNNAIYERLSRAEKERYERTMSGDPDNRVRVEMEGSVVEMAGSGCFPEALVALYGDLSRYLELSFIASNLGSRIRFEAEADPALIAAEEKWSDCMRPRGWQVRNHSDALTMVANAYATQDAAAARTLEISIATDDATCAIETGSVRGAEAALAAAKVKVAADLEGQLLAYQEMKVSALDVARRILEGS